MARIHLKRRHPSSGAALSPKQKAREEMLKEGESFVYTACPGWGDHDYCALKTIVKDGKIFDSDQGIGVKV